MSRVNGPAVVVTTSDIRRVQLKAAIATALCAVAIACWTHLLSPAIAEDGKAAVASALFRVGEHLCRRNDGLRAIEAYAGKDAYDFHCRDGASFQRINARIER